MYAVRMFKEGDYTKLYLVQQDSHHDKRIPEESFTYIFPKLSDLYWLEFISWSQFDTLKKQEHFELKNNDGSKWWTDKNITQLSVYIYR